jgi:hypothetical protein
MTDPIIGYNFFTDAIRRPIYSDGDRQYVYDPDGERIYGLWMIPEEDRCDLPVIVDMPNQ